MVADPSPSSRLKADIDRTLREINRSFDPLKKDFPFDFHVTGAREGYVCLSVVMPDGMIRAFMTMLRSLHGFFRQIDIKAGHANSQSRTLDPQEVERRHQLQEDYRTEVCSLFDEFTRQGLPSNEAVKKTNAAMKKRNHPWATHDLITSALRSEGRFRKKKSRSK